MKELEYDHLEDVIKAHPKELVDFLDYNATYRGDNSWLFVPLKSENKVCLVAHIDTIFESDDERKDVIKTEDNIWSSPQGICGDDRCGVFALLKLYRTLPEKNKPMLLFTDGEERGGIGAREACKIFKKQLKDVTFFVELDRQGKDDMVFYNDEPQEFRNHIEQYGFNTSMGSFSDISIIGREFNKCCVNLSVGYYNQHTLNESINCNELIDTMNKVAYICVNETGKNKIWENYPDKQRLSNRDKYLVEYFNM